MLIIIDTINRAAPGVDENSPYGMGKILDGAAAIQAATGALVLLVHHPGKDASRGLRGHSSLHAAMDAVVEVERNGESRWLKVAKAKDGEEGIIHAFRLAQLELEASETGKVHSSCVVEFLPDSVPVQTTPKGPPGDNQRVLLLGFEDLLTETGIAYYEDGTPCTADVLFEDAVSRLKERLADVEPKRQKERARAGLESLVKTGWLTLSNGRLSLPSRRAASVAAASVEPSQDEESPA